MDLQLPEEITAKLVELDASTPTPRPGRRTA